MAQTGNPYSCGSRQARRQHLPCGGEDTFEKGRINDYAAVKKGIITAAMKAAGYAGLVAAIVAAEKSCDAVVIRNISGTYDGGAITKGKGAGRQKERTTGRTCTVDITDFGIVGNEEFWDVMEGSASQYDHFVFGATKVYPFEADPDIAATNPITDDSEADIEGGVKFVFNRRSMLKSYDYDREGLLSANAPFLAFVALTSTTATVLGEQATVAKTTPFSIETEFTPFPAGAVLDYAVKAGDKLPAGLVLLPNGVLDAAVGVATGKYEFAVQATNPCGILGEVTITLIVTA